MLLVRREAKVTYRRVVKVTYKERNSGFKQKSEHRGLVRREAQVSHLERSSGYLSGRKLR